MTTMDAAEHTDLVWEVGAAMAPVPGRIAGPTRLADELGYDSLRLLELAIVLEEAFDVSVMFDPHGVVETVDDVIRLLEDVLGKGRGR